ncbi:SgcJ/EcaC family oxidoreductase [Microbispora sp. NPDC049125]|uniref:SgcJ/EcaC family oxidoreductase n=1 Tax=Microbispora sp. NPDC049125 TaxID=3154929 RepID=UPI0034675374
MSEQIHHLLAALTDAWNAGDAAAYADLFTEDADYVTFFGHHSEGRRAIEEGHRALFEGPLRGSRLASPASGEGGAKIRPLGPGVALVVVTGGSALAGGAPDPSRDSIMTLTAVSDGGRWRFASFHNTRISAP